MKLVGTVAEKRDLNGGETLSELLDTFTEEKATLKDLLPTMKKDFIKTVVEEQGKIRKAMRYLINDVPLHFQIKDIESALRSLAADYMCSELNTKYDRISPHLFDLERAATLTIEDRYYSNEKEIEVAIPLFACVNLGEDIWKLRNVRVLDKDRDYKVSIEAKVPPITRKVKEKAKEATADYMRVCSKALKEQSIGDILLRDIESGDANLDLRVCWIPSIRELKIETERIYKDPLLIANTYGRNFLVAKWDVQGEEPYEHYIKEFTEKKAGK